VTSEPATSEPATNDAATSDRATKGSVADDPRTQRPAPVVRAFRLLALTEAVTWAGLLVGMLLEHVLDVTELGVYVFGRLHGGAFLAYVAVALLTWRAQRWSVPVALAALVASIPPFGTVVFERWATRTGRLDAPAEIMRAAARQR